jgi:molybdopterin-guanine dinucleotide biosynthesis protein A
MRSVAILAGGDARRFGGRDKGALVVDGRTILERQISELSTVTPDVHVIRREDDLVPGCGPLGGLHAALNAARGDALFLVACDMPFVTAALAAYLLMLAGDADAVVPRTDRGYHPLCAVYGRACLPAVERRLAERRLKMLDLLHDLRVREVTADEIGRFGNCDRLLANVNTPAEYANLEALQGHKK